MDIGLELLTLCVILLIIPDLEDRAEHRGNMGRVNISKQVLIPGKGKRFCKVVCGGNGKIKPNVILIDGHERLTQKAATTSISFRTASVNGSAAGKTAAEAQHAADRQTKLLTALRRRCGRRNHPSRNDRSRHCRGDGTITGSCRRDLPRRD